MGRCRPRLSQHFPGAATETPCCLFQTSARAMTSEESKALLADLVLLPLRTVPAIELVIDAYELALIHALSVDDATYLALALRHGAGLITADRDLDAAARTCGCTAD